MQVQFGAFYLEASKQVSQVVASAVQVAHLTSQAVQELFPSSNVPSTQVHAPGFSLVASKQDIQVLAALQVAQFLSHLVHILTFSSKYPSLQVQAGEFSLVALEQSIHYVAVDVQVPH